MRIESLARGWIVPQWNASPQVRGFVTTRAHPDAPAIDFDLGPARLDSLDTVRRAAVVANRAFLAARLPALPVWLEQTHGRDVAVIDDVRVDAFRTEPPVADAAVTRMSDVPLAIRVADCMPVFFTDDEGSVVAAAHAGWRGLAAGVLEATIGAMAVPPGVLSAWLGPAIGPQAFEVGDDVVDAFVRDDRDAIACFTSTRAGKWMADLASLARRRLAAAGVRDVRGGDQCTSSDAARFFSWRRDRTPHRMAAVLWRTAPAA
jgi:YfiH family protein